MATTYYSGATTGDPTLLTSWWDTTGGTGNHPANFTSGDTFVIQNTHNYTIPFNTSWTVNATTAGTAATIQINSGGTLTFTLSTGSTCKLFLGGNLVRNGTIAGTATSTTGLIEFTSNGAWTGSGDISGVKASIQVDSGVTLDASGMSSGFKLKSSNTIGITANGTLNMGTLTINGNGNASASFTLGANGTLITATTSASGVPGIFTGFSSGKIILPTTANYTFNGTGAQVTGTTANNATMPTTVNNLTINNAAGLTVSVDTTVNGTLALTAGKVTGNVILASGATLSGGSSSAYVNGQLTVPFSAPSGVTFTFPIGTASAYSPITLANFSDAGSSTLTASATASQNPNQGSSGIDSSLYIARYWTLTDGGGFSLPSYDFTGTYVAGDIQNGADPNNLIVRKWNSSWTAPASSSSSSYTVTGTGFTGSFGQFAAGQAQTTLPVLDTTTKAAITNTSATLGATLENDFSLPVSDYGIVWGTSPSPTTANNKVQAGTSLAAPNSFTANVTGLPVATTIYYRAYAINSSGTGYSTNDSFLTLTNEPTTQASGVTIAARQNGNLAVSWTRGNGARCIVLVKSGSAVDSDPVDGTTYAANAAFGSGTQIGSGNYVAYLGTGTSVTLSGLSGSTTYYLAVYELNGSGGTANYLAPAATGNQTTVATPVTSLTWTGSADSDWNNPNNWDGLQVPDVGTALTIQAAGNPPFYSNQMAAATIGPVTQTGPLTIVTNKFIIDAAGAVPLTVQPNGILTIITNGVVTITNSGSVTMATPTSGTTPIIDVEGGTLILTNNSALFAMGDNTSSDTGIGAVITNNGGHIVIDQQLRVRCRDSRFYMSGGTLDLLGGLNHNVDANDGRQFFAIAGGTANLGTVTIDRATTAGGLSVEGGVVNSSSIRIGTGIAAAYSRMTGGVWTNAGAFYIGDRNNAATSGTRNPIFNMSGGFLATSGSDGMVINNQGETSSTGLSGNGGILQVSGGTIITEGLYLNGPSVTANSAATFQFTGGTMYLGSLGLVANTGGASMTASLTLNGGTLGAKTDWASSAALALSGPLTLKTADITDVAHNITLNGAISGSSGALVKTGAGTLTLNAANTYGGATTISNGVLALGASATLPNTSQINLGSTATFDTSALGGFTLGSGKVLSGSGTVIGAFTAGSGSTINVGNSVGTLTFASGLALGGNTIANFEISPTNNDLIEVTGNVDASVGVNTISITALGGVLAPGTYTLINYTGSLNGDISHFSLVGAPGYLINNTTAQAIQLVTTGVRAPTSIVWVGNATSNNWDVLQHTNWLNGAVLDSFVQGDTVLFDATGAANPSVNITDPVTPASITVDAAADYTFGGSGTIGGTGGLTKTNTGTLVIATTNSYTGPTVIGQGTLEVAQLANGGSSSAIGAANNSTTNLVFYGGTLKYSGGTASTDHGATLNETGGTILVTNSSTVLTDNGTFTGTGTLTKAGQGTLVLAAVNTHSGGTAVTNGTLQINTATSLGTGAFTNINGTLKLNSALTVANTVEFDGTCTVDLSNAGGDTALDGAWTGSGNVTVINQQSSARTFTVGGNGSGGGSFSGFSGTLNMGTNSGFLRFNDGGGNPNLGSPNMIADLGTGSATLLARNGAITIDLGALRGGPATRLSGRASGTAGTITYSIGALGIDSTFAGTITNGNSDVAVIKVGAGKLTLSGTNTYTGSTIVNSGGLEVDGAILNGSLTVYSGTLSGAGTIGGATTLSGYTTLAPGSGGIGTLTFSSSLSFDTLTTNAFVVTTSGGVSNAVVVNGGLYPNNSIIQITSGTALAAGTYTLFTYSGGIGGSFNPTPIFDVAPAGTASIVDTGSQINLVIQTSSGPSISGLDVSTLQSGTVGISVTNGTPNSSFAVLVSTNLALPIAEWTSVVTNQLDGNGAFTGTVSVDSTAPQQFLMLQVLP